MRRTHQQNRAVRRGCVAIALLSTLNAWGADDALNRRVQDLEGKVKSLETEKAKGAGDAKAGSEGFHLKSSDGAFQLRVGGISKPMPSSTWTTKPPTAPWTTSFCAGCAQSWGAWYSTSSASR